jgi:hypothetical protein
VVSVLAYVIYKLAVPVQASPYLSGCALVCTDPYLSNHVVLASLCMIELHDSMR